MKKKKVNRHPCVVKQPKNTLKRACALCLCVALPFALCTCGTKKTSQEPDHLSSSECVEIVYLDAGHGGFDVGAVGKTVAGEEVLEKDITLSIVQLVAQKLRTEGYTVLCAREGDTRLTDTTSRDEVLARRAAANEAGADLLLSINANAYAGAGRAYGARVYYHPESTQGAAYADTLGKAITRHTHTLIGRECRTIPDDTYLILGNSDLPTLLLEVGFLSDAVELALLVDPVYQDRLASAVCEAVIKMGRNA